MTKETNDLIYEQFKYLLDLRRMKLITAEEARLRMHGFITCLYMMSKLSGNEYTEKCEILGNPDFKMFDF